MNTHAAAVSTPSPWLELRPPAISDGASIWRLVKASPPLELNSCYAYLMFCRDFADTSIIAEADEGLAGFVVGYRRPVAPDTLFVWQVAVDCLGRGRGLAVAMLVGLLCRPVNRDVRFLETTVTLSNEASQRLFRGLARKLGAACEETRVFAAERFAEKYHEEEVLFRVGPILPSTLKDLQGKLLKKASDYSDLHWQD